MTRATNPALAGSVTRVERGVFLDRDGTLIVERTNPVRQVSEIELLPGAAQAVASFNKAGWLVVLVTNQAAIARGAVSWDEYELVRVGLAEKLREHSAHLDFDLCCPHHQDQGQAPYSRPCGCRKPQPGMLQAAMERCGPCPRRWSLIGDAWRDLAAANAAGVESHLVLTGKGALERARCEQSRFVQAHQVHADLGAAARALLQGK